MEIDDCNMHRLSDRILFALDLALNQKDIDLAEKLSQALEMSMTRGAGGENFEERRDYPAPIANALNKFDEIKAIAS